MEAAATNPRPRKTTKGRQKIEIKKVEKENSRYVTFSKRKNGIFKKATELSSLCGADVAVIIFSEHGKVFSSGNPDDADKILERYLANSEEVEVEDEASSSESKQTYEQEQEHLDALRRLEEMKRTLKMTQKKRSMKNEGFWWDQPMIENKDKKEVEVYKESLQELKKNVMSRIEVMAGYNASTDESRIISQFIDQSGVWSNSSSSLFASGLNCELFNSFTNGAGF